MRTVNSVKNIAASTLTSLITILVGLIAQAVFVNRLGLEYLGINSLFTNVISMLAVIELGFGVAIIYSLYTPLVNKDISTIKSLMRFYKIGYRTIAVLIGVVGLCILPFLHSIVGEVRIAENISLIYLLFLADVTLSYSMTYKRSLLYADQKNYVVNVVHAIYILTLNIVQILILIYTANFIVYLLAKIIARIAENLVLNYIVDRRYPLLSEKNVDALDPLLRKDIFKKIKALFYHKLATFIVLGTDNVIISIFLGITTVGLYANYFLITSAISVLIGQAFVAITASVGNLLVTSTPKRTYGVFRHVQFANFWLASFASIALLICMDSFVRLWLGEQFILTQGVLLAICVNVFFSLFRSAISSFKDAAAIYHEDRYIPIIESAVNVVAAITLLHFFGLAGVFMGTICSTLILHLYSYPKFVYTRLFHRSYKDYYKEFGSYILVALAAGALTFAASTLIAIENGILQFIANVALCILLPNIIFYALYRRREEFIYYRHLFTKLGNKIIKQSINENK